LGKSLEKSLEFSCQNLEEVKDVLGAILGRLSERKQHLLQKLRGDRIQVGEILVGAEIEQKKAYGAFD
jgi:hypothetical protein